MSPRNRGLDEDGNPAEGIVVAVAFVVTVGALMYGGARLVVWLAPMSMGSALLILTGIGVAFVLACLLAFRAIDTRNRRRQDARVQRRVDADRRARTLARI